MTAVVPETPLDKVDIPTEVLDWVGTYAQAIDSGSMQAREVLPQLASARLLDLGAPVNRDGGLLQQAAVFEVLARRSLSAAFAAWGHRMCIEFLEFAGGTYAASLLPAMRSGTTPAAAAMAPGYKALATGDNLNLWVTRDTEGKLHLSGRIAWASNLYPDAIAIAPAYGPEAPTDHSGTQDAVVVASPLSAVGVHIGAEPNLLAMQGTASTYVTLENVALQEDQILTSDFDTFLQRSRPTLSILQASFCLGLATVSYQQATGNATGVNQIFLEEIQELGEQLTSVKRQMIEVASRIGTDDPPDPARILGTRVQAGQLAVELTALETKTSGGKGFVTTSDTNRRYREATFIPLQAPSEAQLRWELDQLS